VDGMLNACLENLTIISQTMQVVCTQIVAIRDAPDPAYRMLAFNHLGPILNGVVHTVNQSYVHVESSKSVHKEELLFRSKHSNDRIAELNQRNNELLNELNETRASMEVLTQQKADVEANLVQSKLDIRVQNEKLMELVADAETKWTEKIRERVADVEKKCALEQTEAVSQILKQASDAEQRSKQMIGKLEQDNSRLNATLTTMELDETNLTTRNKELELRLLQCLRSDERLTPYTEPVPPQNTDNNSNAHLTEFINTRIKPDSASPAVVNTPTAPPPTPYLRPIPTVPEDTPRRVLRSRTKKQAC